MRTTFIGTVRHALLALLICLIVLNRVTAIGRADEAPAKASPKAVEKSIDRTVLPVAEPKLAAITTLDVREAKAPPRF